MIPIIEDGAKIIDGVWQKSEGSVIIEPNVYFQSFVSVKKGLRKNTNTIIGQGSYICSFVNIGHNVRIGSNCFIATGAKILGNVTIGDHVYLGANCVIIDEKKIGNWVKVRAGEIVNRDIPDYSYYGKNGRIKPNWYAQTS